MNNPVSVLRRRLRGLACALLGKHLYYTFWFRCRHGYWPRLSKPETLNAKLLWTALNAELEPLYPYVDKVAVKDYVAKCVGEEVLIPTIATAYHEQEIPPLRELPNSFVAKATHGSHMVLIVKDKSSISEAEYRATCCKWLRTSFYKLTGERVYTRVPPAVIIEPLLGDANSGLMDYKFLCYDGEPLYVDVHGFRFADHRREVYTTNWERLPITWGRRSGFARPVPRPVNLSEMTQVARSLASRFSFVRVDLYSLEGRVLFGELTFVPGNARSPIRPYQYDVLLGAPLVLTRSVERKPS